MISEKIATKRGIQKMSAQAVGGVVGSNSICIIIPYYRVVGRNGKLSGYGGKIKKYYQNTKKIKNVKTI